MPATYASFLLVLGASAVAGQAILALSGRRTPSALAPAVGLAALVSLAWAAVRLPGEGAAALAAIGAAVVASALVLRGRLAPVAGVPAVALTTGAIATVATSLPFLVEGRFGILGTGLNPDMSQHLLATERLATGGGDRLIAEGYPLGPHALVVAVSELGPSAVHAFGGLTLAVAVAASLVPLAVLGGLAARWRIGAALVVGFAYLAAAYLVQGAFKETIQALFLLAFAVGLHELVRGWRDGQAGRRALRALPLAALAIGSVYAYSFPGLAWLVGAAAAWAALELALARRRGGQRAVSRLVREAAPAATVAGAVLLAAILPEIGRIVEFARFETFDPDGPGLGNLFGRLSPLVALGIWPSGDFRVAPGDGAAPAAAFYLGAMLAFVALAAGLHRWLKRGERVVPAALAAATILWLYALVAGTPYQEAKALALAAPLVALIAVRGLVVGGPRPLALAYLVAAAASSLLVLANGPVGPSSHSTALRELQPTLGSGSTLVLAPPRMLEEEHGRDYLVWELRGGRVCVAEAGPPSGAPPPPEVARVLIVEGGRDAPPFSGLELERAGEGYVLWALTEPVAGEGPCPFISDGARADPGDPEAAGAGDAAAPGRE